MVHPARALAFTAASLLLSTSAIGGSEAIRMRVSPPMSIAPAFLTIELAVASHADNRYVDIVAESADFYRSSRIPLDGEHGPSRGTLQFRNLPPGEYYVTSTLMGSVGPRGSASAVAKVTASAGSGR